MTRHDFGRLVESRFVFDATEQGFLVTPCPQHPGYDAIVDSGGRLFRVQVKGSSLIRRCDGRKVFAVNFNYSRSVRSKQFDVLAMWMREEAMWLLVPRDRVERSCYYVHAKHAWRRFANDWGIFRRK